MAHLKGPLGWLVAALVTCAAVGVTYLPPRGMSREPRGTQSGLMTGPPTAERLRANELAKEWRRAAMDVRLHEWRQRLSPELERLRAANQPTIVTSIDSAWPPAVRERAQREIDNAWRALDLGTTKIGIAVVVEAEHVESSASTQTGNAHLLPDSVNRHACVAWTAPRPAMRSSFERNDPRSAGWHTQWARALLGPCAFYARFGRPSAEVERWLAHKQFRFAQMPTWDSTWAALLQFEGERPDAEAAMTRSARAARLAWMLQTYPVPVLGCVAGRTAACRDAAIGAVPSYGTAVRLITRSRERDADLPGSSVLLSDMVREFGSARFGRFWSSDLSPDSAFQIAMDTTLGDWLLERQRGYGIAFAASPKPRLGASAFGLAVVALSILLAIAGARRRQVG